MGIAEKGTPRKKGAPRQKILEWGRWLTLQGNGGAGRRSAGPRPQPGARIGPGTCPRAGKRPGPVSPQGQGVLGEEPAVPQGRAAREGGGAGAGRAGASTGRRARGAGGPAASRCPGQRPELVSGIWRREGTDCPSCTTETCGHKRQRTAAGRQGTGGRCRSVPPPSRARAYCQGRTGVAAVRLRPAARP